jgi:hypothetical protein
MFSKDKKYGLSIIEDISGKFCGNFYIKNYFGK